MSNSIHVEKLTKKYGEFTAVDSIDLSIKQGELFGLLDQMEQANQLLSACWLLYLVQLVEVLN